MKETKNKKMNFIRTTDADTAQQLRQCGYTELTEQSSACYCFLNDGKLKFDENEEMAKKMHYTNIMCI